MSSDRFWAAGALVLATMLGVASVAQAAPEPSAAELKTAKQLFEEAERDETAGRWREALDKFTRVVSFKETPSGLFHKAFCEEKVGLVLAAYRDYKRAAQLSETYAGASAENKKLIDKETTSRMVALLPRIPSLKLRTPLGVAGVRVVFDDAELGPDELNVSRQVELGQHVVEASAPGRPPFRSHLALSEGANEALSIVFAEPTLVPLTPPGGASGVSLAPPERSSSSRRTALVWAGVGTSAALAATGVVFFLRGRANADDLERECSRTDALCRRDDIEGARDRNYVVAGVAGGLAVVGAGVTVWLARSTAEGSKTPRSALMLGPRGISVSHFF
jgi:hypothetical protein